MIILLGTASFMHIIPNEKNDLHLPSARLNVGRRTFRFSGSLAFNCLHLKLKAQVHCGH